MVVKVKVCGLTNLIDVQAAIAAGADLLGFIFYPRSPRYVTPDQVRDILAAAGLWTGTRREQATQTEILSVGVFVNESPQMVAQTLEFCGLDLAQLHGEEPPAMLGLEGGESLPGGRAYKALRPQTGEEARQLAARYALPPRLRGEDRPALLLDAYHPHLRGGTGVTGNWELASSLAGQYPILLAGGLTPDNVADAVQAVRPWGVDVASGVEERPGKKDHAALRAFVAIAKAIQ
ncbi:MAG: phosphoribosylanthranilate isomerase [Anaerolineae bacterium]